jgi:ketosteroid isomerase-like protein
MADERTTRSTAPDKVTDTETEVIQRLVSQWCEAHNAKNLDALSATYASSVFFYGRQQSSAACVASKKGLFAKNQEFTQTIVGGVQVQVQNLEARVAFMKRVVLSGTVTDYPSYLGLTKTSVGWRISVEGDDVTDANLQKAMGAAYRRAAGAGIESTDDVTASGSRWLTQYRLTAISGSKVSTRSRRTSRTRASSS